MHFSGILFFPVTPFSATGALDAGLTSDHVASGVEAGAGGVFPACGTGEYHALALDEIAAIVAATVGTVAGRVPVIAGAGGPLGHAIAAARAARDAGADGLLVLPPYLVGGTQSGLVAYVEAICQASGLPVVIYHRGTAQYTAETVARLARDPQVIGFKDGVGDVGLTQQIVRRVQQADRDDFLFFNGLLTAELSQGAYRGIGVPMYSSAAFAMAPEIANAYYRAYDAGDEATRLRLIDGFYTPLVALRDETPGFGVSLVKAGLRLAGVPVGGVRAPLVDPTAEQQQRLADILEAGRSLL
ncbi:5-dehydro-4-deoxyglucarate dehydratase [Agromyces sp. CCNWLW203]|uniref:5-dehydro-4-deoxyglucarate dehydratase n=1 Tax=Agromyces sp. CCNWLW203 TaxID=3112842 RepID=UPI002F96AF1B